MRTLTRMRAKARSDEGFTLVEVVIASTIFLMVMVMATYVVQQTTLGYASSQQRSAAAILANNDLSAAFAFNCGMETGVVVPPTGSALPPTQNQKDSQPGAPSQAQILGSNNCGKLYNTSGGSTQIVPGAAGVGTVTVGDPLPYKYTSQGYDFQVNYTSAWTTGTSGSYNECPSGATAAAPSGQVRNILIGWPASGPTSFFPGPTSWTTAITTRIFSGAAISSVAVAPLPTAIANGTVLFLESSAGNSQTVTAQAAAAGATSITIQGAPIATYGFLVPGSYVSPISHPGTWSTTLSTAISAGTTISSISVAALPASIAQGSKLYLLNNTTGGTQSVIANAASAGATSITVQGSPSATSSYTTTGLGTSVFPPASASNAWPLSTFAALPTNQVLYTNSQDGQLELTGMVAGSYAVVSMPGWTPVRRFAGPTGCAWFPFLAPNSQNPNTPAGPSVTYYTPDGNGGYSGKLLSSSATVTTGALEQCTVAGGCP